MKKFYSILLSAVVAVSATAVNAEKLQTSVAAPSQISLANPALMKKAPVMEVNVNAMKAAQDAFKAPAKAAATTMDALVGVYDYSMTVYTGQSSSQNYASTNSIVKGEGPNDIIIKGLRFVDIDVKGTVDFTKGIITLPVQELFVRTDGIHVCLYTAMKSQTEWSDAPVTIKINEDGTLTSDDFIMYGLKERPGYVAAQFDNLKLVPSTMNTTATLWEYDTDAQGNFLTTTTEFTTYCKAELVDNYVKGTEELGECVVLKDFLGPDYGATTTYDLPLSIDRDYKEVYLDPWYWINITLVDNQQNEVDCLLAAITGVQDEDAIVGTYSENTIEWTTDWFLYAANASSGQGLGPLAKFKGAKFTFSFNVENPGAGINDVIADSDANAPVEFFNLQGARISNPAAGQLVIRRQGKTVTKVFVK